MTPSHDDGKWVFTGDTSKVSGQVKAIPDIPTTVMAQAQASLRVLPRERAAAGRQAVDRSRRCASAGTTTASACCCRATSESAEAAFLKVTEMEPGYADGWVNVGARADSGRQHDGAGRRCCSKALTIDPELAKTHFFLGTALKSLGRVRRSARRTCAPPPAQYPRDRVVLNQLGRVLFLQARSSTRRSRRSNKVLAIDPEDLQAHYNLMLCYQGLGDAEQAAREQALYERFKADESSQAITGPYRQLHRRRQQRAAADPRAPERGRGSA